MPANAPRKLGSYALKRLIGRGGMAEAYLAERAGPAGFKKDVVVKRIHPARAQDKAFIDLFLREATLAAGLNHPNLVQVHELGEDGGEYFIAMEYVDGITAARAAQRAWAVRRSTPMEFAVRCIADAALGLHHAHESVDSDGKRRGLVHRDVSPDNLMVNRDGITKVLDFGVAKDRACKESTDQGLLRGKMHFMAPEYIDGKPLDGRADLYALGCCLYWMLTARLPFEGATDAVVMEAALEQPAANPQDHNVFIPPALAAITLRLLAKRPEQRLATGRELHDALVELFPDARDAAAAFACEAMALPDPHDLSITRHPDLGEVPPCLPTRELSGRAPPAPAPARGELSGRAVRATFVGVLGAAALMTLVLVRASAGRPPAPAPAILPAPPPPEPPPPAPAPAPAPTVAPVPAQETPPPPAPEPPARRPRGRERAHAGDSPAAGPGIAVRAPPTVAWQDLTGRALGRGNAVLRVPEGTRYVVAVDAARGATTRVPLQLGAVDYARLPRGSLTVHFGPDVRAWLGRDALKSGVTRSLVAGSYRLRLVLDGNEQTQQVEVQPNGSKEINVGVTLER